MVMMMNGMRRRAQVIKRVRTGREGAATENCKGNKSDAIKLFIGSQWAKKNIIQQPTNQPTNRPPPRWPKPKAEKLYIQFNPTE